MLNRSGFTLIEVVITVTIIAFLTAIASTNFAGTRARIAFQSKVSEIESGLKFAKSQAYNLAKEENQDNDSKESGVVALFQKDNQNPIDEILIYKTEDINSLDFIEANQLKSIPILGSNLLIEEFNFRNFEVNNDKKQIETIDSSIYIVFSADGCKFSLKQGDINQLMLQIPLKMVENEESRVVRNLYMHASSCMPEILVDNLFEND